MKYDTLIRTSIKQSLTTLQVSPQKQHSLIDEITGGRKMKRKVTFSAALVAVLVFASVTALAVGISGVFGNINWLGEVMPEDQSQQPFATATPMPQENSDDLFDLEQEIMNGRAEKELVYIEEGNGGSWTKRTQAVYSMEEFNDLIKTTALLPTPNAVPDGYHFTDGYVIFDCQSDGEFDLFSQETLPEGITVSRYRVDDSMDFISGYDLTFIGSNPEDYISIYVNLKELTDVTEYSMGVNSDEQAHAVEIQGMDNAIVITSDDSSYLAMRRVLDETVDYLEFVPDAPAEVRSFEEVLVEVCTRQLNEETLIGLFADN